MFIASRTFLEGLHTPLKVGQVHYMLPFNLYVNEIRYLTMSEHKVKIVKNKVLSNTFVPKRKEICRGMENSIFTGILWFRLLG